MKMTALSYPSRTPIEFKEICPLCGGIMKQVEMGHYREGGITRRFPTYTDVLVFKCQSCDTEIKMECLRDSINLVQDDEERKD